MVRGKRSHFISISVEILRPAGWHPDDQIPIECNPTETEDETRDNHTTIFSVLISFKFAFRDLPLKKKNGLCTSACDLGPGTLEMTVFFSCGMFWLWAENPSFKVFLRRRAVSLASHEQKRSTICWAGEVYLEWAIPWVYRGSLEWLGILPWQRSCTSQWCMSCMLCLPR